MQNSSRVKIIINEQVCTIVDANSHKELSTFHLKDNLDSALVLLKKINKIVTEEGEPIYRVRMVGEVSAWSFHQNTLFWEYLRHFVYFEDVIIFLTQGDFTVVVDEKTDGRILSLLIMSEIKIETLSVNTRIYSNGVISIINIVCAMSAWFLGFFAVVFVHFGNTKTLVYSPDKYDSRFKCDFRLQEIYTFLRSNKIKYIEIFHTTLGRSFIKNIFLRKKFALYREYLPFSIQHSSLVDKVFLPVISGFEKHQEKYVENLVKDFDKASIISVLRVLTLKRLIRYMGIQVLVTVDDMRSVQEIITACRMLKIKTYGFQHGHINLYHTGLMNYGIPKEFAAPFDRLYVWNPYWLEKLTAFSSMYTTSNVSIGGYLRPPKIFKEKIVSRKIPQSFKELSVLVVNDTWAPKNEVRDYIKRLLSLGCTLYMGVRPDLPIEKQLADFGLTNIPDVHTCVGADPEVIKKVDCVAGVYSTFLYEMMNFDLPVLALDTSFSFGDDLVIDNLARRIKIDFTFDDIRQYLISFQSKRDIIWPQQKETVQTTLHTIYEHYSTKS